MSLLLTAIRVEVADWQQQKFPLATSNASDRSQRPHFISNLVKVLDAVGSKLGYSTDSLNALCSALEKPFLEHQQIGKATSNPTSIYWIQN